MATQAEKKQIEELMEKVEFLTQLVANSQVKGTSKQPERQSEYETWDVYYVQLPESDSDLMTKTRPCILLWEQGECITVIPITKYADYRGETHVKVKGTVSVNGLSKKFDNYAAIKQITTVPKKLINGQKMDRLEKSAQAMILLAILDYLGFGYEQELKDENGMGKLTVTISLGKRVIGGK